MMMKRIFPWLGALALSVALVTGCQDSTGVDPLGTTTSTDDAIFKVYTVDESVNALELPQTYEAGLAAISNPNDPLFLPPNEDGRGGKDDTLRGGKDDTTKRGGGNGGADTGRKGGRPDDKGGLRPDNYIRILKHLNLSDSQWVAIRGCFKDYQECVRSVHARYHAAIGELRSSFQADVARLKAAVAAGDITPEEARAIYRRLHEEYKGKAEALKGALRTALEECRTSLLRCIKSHLTAEQLARFEALLSGGPNNGGPGRG